MLITIIYTWNAGSVFFVQGTIYLRLRIGQDVREYRPCVFRAGNISSRLNQSRSSVS